MAESPTAAQLRNADGSDALAQPCSIAGEGLDLVLLLEEGQELDPASELRLLPAPGPGPGPGSVEEETLGALVSTDSGPLGTDRPSSWLSADWGVERPLSCIDVNGYSGKARAKIFTCGVWLPLTPTDLIACGSEQRFPPIKAGKVMIELVAAHQTLPGVWIPAPAQVQALTLKAAMLPGDLSLAITGQAPFFRWTGLLPIAGIPAEGFAAAINAYLAKPDAARPVRLTLSAAAAGKLTLDFTPRLLSVATQLDGPADGRLRLTWRSDGRAAATGKVRLKEGAQLRSLAFTAKAELPPVRILGGSATGQSARSQWCTALDGLAQCFLLTPPPALVGLDIPLGLRGATLKAVLALHPDHYGRPGAKPYGGAVLPIAWPADAAPRAVDGWLTLDFPLPLQLPDPVWWVVLSVKEGQALWPLDDAPPPQAGACLYQQGEAPWLPRTTTPADKLWALLRLRLHAPELKPSFEIRVTRGENSVVLPCDRDGRVRADAAALAQLNARPDVSVLEIHGSASGAGCLDLSDIRVVYR